MGPRQLSERKIQVRNKMIRVASDCENDKIFNLFDLELTWGSNIKIVHMLLFHTGTDPNVSIGMVSVLLAIL